MITIPMLLGNGTYDLLIILEQNNMERIIEYDPAEIVISKLPEEYRTSKLNAIMITYADHEEAKRISECRDHPSLMNTLRTLMRGWKYQPQKGDNDLPYQKPQEN